MRIRRFKMTTKKTMVAILVVALVLGGLIAWQRHERRQEVRFYLQQARFFEEQQRQFLERALAIEHGNAVANYPGEPLGRAARAAWSRNQASTFADNARFFRHVATRPQLLADPDLPQGVPSKGNVSPAALQ